MNQHRRHLVETKPRRFDEFESLCGLDSPNKAVVQTMHMLCDGGADIWIWSARSVKFRHETTLWLMRHAEIDHWVADKIMRMRPIDDNSADEDLKRGWLTSMTVADRARLVAIFDDRDKVVRMWRSMGVACFQVAPGDF